jgi:hypothetical protein
VKNPKKAISLFYKAVSTAIFALFVLATCDFRLFLFWPTNYFFDCHSR